MSRDLRDALDVLEREKHQYDTLLEAIGAVTDPGM